MHRNQARHIGRLDVGQREPEAVIETIQTFLGLVAGGAKPELSLANARCHRQRVADDVNNACVQENAKPWTRKKCRSRFLPAPWLASLDLVHAPPGGKTRAIAEGLRKSLLHGLTQKSCRSFDPFFVLHPIEKWGRVEPARIATPQIFVMQAL